MPDYYFLEYEIDDRGSKIEDLESASETTSWISATAERKQRDKEEAASKEHSTPPTKESWPIWIRSSLNTTDSQMPDLTRLYSNSDYHSRRDRSSEPQYRARHEGAVRRHAEPVLTHQERGTEIFLSVPLLGLQRKCQTGPIAYRSSGSRRSRSKALLRTDLQWTASSSSDSLLW